MYEEPALEHGGRIAQIELRLLCQQARRVDRCVVLGLVSQMLGAAVVPPAAGVGRDAVHNGVAHHRRAQTGQHQAFHVVSADPRREFAPRQGLRTVGTDAQAYRLDPKAVKVVAAQVFAVELADGVVTIRAGWHVGIDHLVLAVIACHMQRTGDHQTRYPMAARSLIQVAQANDIGRQNTVKTSLLGHAPHVHHRVHARQQLVHGLGIFQTGATVFLARTLRA